MNLKKKVLVVGCSFTRGHGLKYESNDPNLWVNKIFPPEEYTVTNLAVSGVNNHWIFLETMSQLVLKTYDIVLVGWSAIPRFNFYVGLELYPVLTKLTGTFDVNLNNHVTISGKHLKSIGDNLLKLHNDHWDFLELVKYVNALVMVQKKKNNGQIFFVNTLGPWPDKYFTKKQINLPTDLTQFEQNLLQVETRDDKEIFQLYDMIHEQYKTYGGIQEGHWLNLYSSLKSIQIDNVSATDFHPGYKSQVVFAEMLLPMIKEKLEQ